MRNFLVVVGVAALLATSSASAQVLAQGTTPFYEPFNGPAQVTIQKFTFQPGQSNAWHVHPGPVAVVIVSGTITEETGCGEVNVYGPGQVFTESYPDVRIHRVVNYGSEPVVFYSTVIKPPGTVGTNFPAPLCGPPKTTSDCLADGWMRFAYPQTFANQGECVAFVNAKK